MNINVFLDNSRVSAREDCPYRRYVEYHYNQVGVTRAAHRAPLLEGSAVHEGLAVLLQGGNEEEAVQKAVGYYRQAVLDRGVVPEDDTPDAFFVDEQAALAEALIRAANRTVIPQILEQYQIEAVEQEYTVHLGEGQVMGPDGEQHTVLLNWMSRADWVGRNLQTGMLELGNWKTAKRFDERENLRIEVDNQTAGELYAAQSFFREPVAGVNYIYLLKGERRKDPSKGFWVTYNHLIRGWHKHADVGGMTFAWRWEVKDPFDGSSKRLGRDMKPFWPHEQGPDGIKTWIDTLQAQGAWPRESDGYMGTGALDEAIIWPAIVSRSQDELQRRNAQVVRDELRWLSDHLWAREPSRHSGRCIYPSPCLYVPHCHKGESLDNEENWVARIPNHPQEGFINIGPNLKKGV